MTVVRFEYLTNGQTTLAKKIISHFFFVPGFFWLRRKLQKIFAAQGSFDLVLSSNGGYPGSLGCLAALWAARNLGIPARLLLVHHAADARSAFRLTIEAILDHLVQEWATGIVTVSLATRESLRWNRGFTMEKCPLHVIPNGIDVSSQKKNTEQSLRKQFNIKQKTFLVGMVGRLERYKGQEDLILALGLLPSNLRHKISVILVGEGNEREVRRLQALVVRLNLRRQVHFTGYLPIESVLIMKEFDLLAMLTKDFEGFGLTIAEAMAAGTPVLATSVGGVTEFTNPEIAYLVPPGSPIQISLTLTKILKEKDKSRQMAQKAKQHILKFSGKHMAKMYYNLMSSSVNQA